MHSSTFLNQSQLRLKCQNCKSTNLKVFVYNTDETNITYKYIILSILNRKFSKSTTKIPIFLIQYGLGKPKLKLNNKIMFILESNNCLGTKLLELCTYINQSHSPWL